MKEAMPTRDRDQIMPSVGYTISFACFRVGLNSPLVAVIGANQPPPTAWNARYGNADRPGTRAMVSA